MTVPRWMLTPEVRAGLLALTAGQQGNATESFYSGFEKEEIFLYGSVGK